MELQKIIKNPKEGIKMGTEESATKGISSISNEMVDLCSTILLSCVNCSLNKYSN
jgi:hypothetical protein